MPSVKENIQVSIGKENTWGTAATRNVLIPFSSFNANREVNHVIDNSVRGRPIRDYQAYRAGESNTVSIEGNAYTEEIGHILMAILGSDTVEGGSAPYKHTFKAAEFPPSYTIEEAISSIETYVYPGCYCEEVTFRFAVADGALTYSSSWRGKKDTTGIKTSLEPTDNSLFLGRQASIVLNSQANTRLIDFEITMARTLSVVHTAQNTSDVGAICVGPIEVTGSATFDLVDTTEIDLFKDDVKGNLEVALTIDPSNSIKFLIGKAYMEGGEIDRGGDYITVSLNFRALYDGVAGSSIVVELTNARQNAY